jgi:rhodanese-related sulfurtransferase/CRP-like cAMP-binding protein
MSFALDVRTLGGLEPIASFAPARLREVLDYCQIETVAKGEDAFCRHGLQGQSVYLVGGEIELVYRDGNRVIVNAHSEWARHPLGKRQPDIVSATALCESQLLRIDDELLDRMVTFDQFAQHDFPGGWSALQGAHTDGSAVVKRLLNSSMFSAENLKNGPLANLPLANVNDLLQRIDAIAVWADDVIIREGDEGDYYYLIDSGRARVSRRIGGVDMPLAELKAGDVFGEEALVSGGKRNATVAMRSNGVLLRLSRQDFMALLQEPLLHKVGYQQACQEVENGAIWLDVRHPPEYRYDRLRGAMNVPLNDVRNAINVLERDKKYITYCQSGRRSAVAAFILSQAGYDVQVLEGGLWSVPRPGQQ